MVRAEDNRRRNGRKESGIRTTKLTTLEGAMASNGRHNNRVTRRILRPIFS